MANTKRSSTENIFGNKGTVRPRQKSSVRDSSQEVMSISDKFDEASNEPEKESNPAELSKSTELDSQPDSNPKNDNTSSKKSALDNLFKEKKGYGTTKSVYFRQDILNYCNSVSKKYGVNFSEVVNKLIEPYLKEE